MAQGRRRCHTGPSVSADGAAATGPVPLWTGSIPSELATTLAASMGRGAARRQTSAAQVNVATSAALEDVADLADTPGAHGVRGGRIGQVSSGCGQLRTDRCLLDECSMNDLQATACLNSCVFGAVSVGPDRPGPGHQHAIANTAGSPVTYIARSIHPG